LVYRVNFLREVKKRIYYRKLFCRWKKENNI
jgi:hypothetical protein